MACVLYFWQVNGTCNSPSLCGGTTCLMTTVTACDVDEVCRKIKDKFGTFKIIQILKFNKPALKKDQSGLNTCGSNFGFTDVTPTQNTCIDCCGML